MRDYLYAAVENLHASVGDTATYVLLGAVCAVAMAVSFKLLRFLGRLTFRIATGIVLPTVILMLVVPAIRDHTYSAELLKQKYYEFKDKGYEVLSASARKDEVVLKDDMGQTVTTTVGWARENLRRVMSKTKGPSSGQP